MQSTIQLKSNGSQYPLLFHWIVLFIVTRYFVIIIATWWYLPIQLSRGPKGPSRWQKATSPLQELKVGAHRVPYLLVLIYSRYFGYDILLEGSSSQSAHRRVQNRGSTTHRRVQYRGPTAHRRVQYRGSTAPTLCGNYIAWSVAEIITLGVDGAFSGVLQEWFYY